MIEDYRKARLNEEYRTGTLTKEKFTFVAHLLKTFQRLIADWGLTLVRHLG